MTARSLTSVALVLLTFVSACRNGDASADTTTAADPVLVGPENIVVVKAEEIRTGPTLSGAIQAEREATVRAEIPASVIETYAEPGQRVAAGTLIARLDDSAIRDQELSTRSNVATAQNAYEIAQRELERAEALLKAGAIAERDMERARNGALAAQTQLSNARAMHASAQQTQSRTRVVAPFAGVISARQVNAGDVVTPGTALFTMVDPSTMRLEASVPAQSLSQVRVGLPVEFAVAGYPNNRFTGRVSRVNPTADPATRQVRIIATIPNAGATLVGGLFAEGRIASETRTAPLVPVVAVDERGVRPSVMRIKNGKVEKLEVELGLRDNQTESVEVRAGLTPGDTVLLGTARGLTPGTPVKVSSPNDVKR
ncbi:MAG TPA: efflux RND transporter periplasmic adaptor subunit [Gemmatimonadaceae bacterium]|nr:efflux RND transporter periplasmic adaptor subunit [Gemmatimonadaceae bacterium]